MSLPCSMNLPTRGPNLRAGTTIPEATGPAGSALLGQARLTVGSKQSGSSLSNSLPLPSPAPFGFPLEENFKPFCYWKEEKHSLWVGGV